MGGKTVAERLAGRDGHYVVEELTVARDAGVEEREDVRVVEAGGDADLAEESLGGE